MASVPAVRKGDGPAASALGTNSEPRQMRFIGSQSDHVLGEIVIGTRILGLLLILRPALVSSASDFFFAIFNTSARRSPKHEVCHRLAPRKKTKPYHLRVRAEMAWITYDNLILQCFPRPCWPRCR